MIQATCFTSLIDYQDEQWPEAFVALPQVGDLVASRDGKVLRVSRVTHCIRWEGDGDPFIRVELYRPGNNTC